MLEINNLSAGYGSQLVLHALNLSVSPREILAVIGPNGAGKTTLIRTISGVLRPEVGTLRVAGSDGTRLTTSQRARLVAVVPQARNLPPTFTVWQAVALGRTPYLGWLGRPHPQDTARVHWALAHTHTTAFANRPISELSGGEQQRVLLARALAQDAPILLLDEPTVHLDLQHQAILLNLVHKLAHEQGLTILMTLHDLNVVSRYADRVALLVSGRLHALGSPQEVLTSNNLSTAYNHPIRVIPHPEYGTPLILPDGQDRPPPEAS